MLDDFRIDFISNKGNTKGRIVSFFYRFASLASKSLFLRILLFPYLIFYKLLFEWFIGFEVPYTTKIGAGFKVFHLQAIVINKYSVIGKGFTCRHNLTIGNKLKGGGCPVIGNNVEVGANVCILGDISIGDNVIIGAGSIVISNIPSNCVVVGNPGKVVKSNIVI